MTSNEIIKADLLDILFDNRNKQYGAYSLRKQYNSRLGAALAIALGAIVIFIFLLKPSNELYAKKVSEKVFVKTMNLIPLVPKPPKAAAPVTPPRHIAERSLLNNMRLVKTPDPKKEIQPVQQLALMHISELNTEGPIVPEVATAPKPQQSAGNESVNNKSSETSFVPLERQPEFPGGAGAWVNFLNRYLQTPADLQPGEKKVVLINFLVDADGTVTGFKVVQSGGSAFDNEVIRVLKKMPKWKPAFQNGHPVTVTFTQPVTFVGVEE